MTTDLSRSIGFILATIVSIALAVFVAAWWLAIAIACLGIATYFWMRTARTTPWTADSSPPAGPPTPAATSA